MKKKYFFHCESVDKICLIFHKHIKIITFFFIETSPSLACIPWNLNLFNFHNILMSKESGGIISSPFL